MDAELSLRCPVLAGRVAQDSYDVIYRGHRVGHIVRDAATSNSQWSWGNSRMPNELGDHGRAATFEDAKAAFLAAWLKPGDPLTRFYRLRERLGRAPDSAAIKSLTGLIAWDDPNAAKT